MRLALARNRYCLPILLGVSALVPAAANAATGSSETTEADVANEPTEYRFEFGVNAGAHFFNKKSGLGRNKNEDEGFSPKTSVALGGHLTLNFNHWVSVEGEALWMPTHSRFSDAEGGAKMNVFGYRGSVVVHLVPHGPVRPFLMVGYGGMSSIANTSVGSKIRSDDDSELHAGVGVKIALGQHAGLRLDGRILVPPAIFGSWVPVGGETGYEGPDFEALGSVFVNFGEIERSRTIVKKEVVVMAPPPNLDPDGDGVIGNDDKCPTVAEDRDGFEDQDGCPDPDNDKDGIPDVSDKCPNDPEDKDGFEDDDGCPDPDNDKDGIPDATDKCPNEPETRNGFQDDDGCPDEVPAAVKKFTGVIEGINFKTAQASILPGSYGILDRAVKVLKDYPDIRLEISGHTDSRGKSDYNRDLSQRRADAVKMYFIANGIDQSRLTTVGYGMDRPIADNATEAGRSKNRRTEFRLLMGDEGPGGAPKRDSGPPPP
jgi:outer membrane protein OmpA-like peptidoglycan-associated protein